MFETLRNAWKIADLRKKIIFTIFIVILYRIGTGMLIPLLDPNAVSAVLAGGENLFDTINQVTGGNLGQTTVFALGVQPYINASIIIQLLTVVIPALERMAKEGEEGRKRMQTITRYVTIGLALVMSVAYYLFMSNSGLLRADFTGGSGVLAALTIIAILMAGTCLTVWLGEEINQRGIGNGISMIIFAGIVSRFPDMGMELYQYFMLGMTDGNMVYVIGAPIMLILYIVMIVFVIYITNAERRVPVQYAKKVVGRKMYGGQSSYIPFKVNMSGVLPVIFASTFLSIPQLIIALANIQVGSTLYNFLNFFRTNSIFYAILYFVLVFAFNIFYTTIQHNPVEIANNLRKNNGAIPGIRPGKPTSDFIQRIVSKITVLGGLFLGLVATVPIIFGVITGMNFAMAGTSIIIVVGVALDTVKAIESQMMMRHYKGFLE